MAAKLKIIMFRGDPDTEKSRHTAFLIEAPDKSNIVVHAVGTEPHFRKTMNENYQYTKSAKFFKEILVAPSVNNKTKEQLGAALWSNTEVKSGNSWNCHSYVEDGLQVLVTKNWMTSGTRSNAIERMRRALRE